MHRFRKIAMKRMRTYARSAQIEAAARILLDRSAKGVNTYEPIPASGT